MHLWNVILIKKYIGIENKLYKVLTRLYNILIFILMKSNIPFHSKRGYLQRTYSTSQLYAFILMCFLMHFAQVLSIFIIL